MITTRCNFLLLISLFPVIVFAQSDTIKSIPVLSDDTVYKASDYSDKGSIKITSLFVSPDIGEYYYYNNSYFNAIVSALNIDDFKYAQFRNSNNGNYSSVSSGSPIPTTYKYNISNNVCGGTMGMVIGSNGSDKIVFNRIVSISVEHTSGSFSGVANYTTGSEQGLLVAKDTITDVFQCSYIQTSVGLHYRFQPTFKWFFLSAGINCSFNFIHVNVQRNKDDYGGGYILDSPPTPSYYHYSNQSDTTYNGFLVNFPVEFGAGARIPIHKFLIEPAFYVTTGFMKGFLIYDASLQLVYKLN